MSIKDEMVAKGILKSLNEVQETGMGKEILLFRDEEGEVQTIERTFPLEKDNEDQEEN